MRRRRRRRCCAEQVDGLRETLRLEAAEAHRQRRAGRSERGGFAHRGAGERRGFGEEEASEAKAEVRAEAARCDRETSQARRERADVARQLEIDYKHTVLHERQGARAGEGGGGGGEESVRS